MADEKPIDGEPVDEKALQRFTQHGGEEWIPSQAPLQPWMCGRPRQADGEPCRRAAVAGGVCLKHGAQLPAVREAHKRRLAALLPKAKRTLGKLLDDPNAFVQLGAVREVHKQTLETAEVAKGANPNGPGVTVNIGFLGVKPEDINIRKDGE